MDDLLLFVFVSSLACPKHRLTISEVEDEENVIVFDGRYHHHHYDGLDINGFLQQQFRRTLFLLLALDCDDKNGENCSFIYLRSHTLHVKPE